MKHDVKMVSECKCRIFISVGKEMRYPAMALTSRLINVADSVCVGEITASSEKK